MVIDMNETQVRTLEQVRQVLDGTEALQFERPEDDAGRYAWVESVLKRFGYRHLSRPDRGTVLAYLQRLSGYSRAQVTRLVSRAVAGKPLVKQYRAPEHAFARRYTAADIALLAEVDRATGTLSGPATVCMLRRQRDVFGDARFVRLGSISVAHLYNLRATDRYRAQRVVTTKTRPTSAVTIGVRKAPAPQGRPGFIRIDSVHQGDQDGVKGLYHINAVDCVTQWQVVASVQTISESHLLPVIEQMLAQFPFALLGFHADNGSEYVNYQVARMLEKLRIEFTRSRPRHSNDNGLAETKNGAVVRKVFGYAHIPQRYATKFNTFCGEYLNPYLNFHRPCLFATEVLDPKKPGRIKRIYRPRDAMTPLEKLASLPNAEKCLRPGISLEELHQLARALSDFDAAQELAQARQALFKGVTTRAA
ncbi:integrase catalytic subunit [Burkholderiales bacterium GJ-E10]|nr:integrase catalytic subunit [Burkholderiales bacterium GJ-E10]BAP87239.1 integrase catalytic subunit [Burkholderiales bacterium GJ-E10]BAP87709.1 integrase catalytic subunit [Burkholderiales bacterium GJ-E10]BAP89527.1 integrase catalytic subunit [Burkholderiales bacterium GJ-E10]BAP89683.1 integrase catalytic subunit [Burkholderiales bacterium GJ-E10]